MRDRYDRLSLALVKTQTRREDLPRLLPKREDIGSDSRGDDVRGMRDGYDQYVAQLQARPRREDLLRLLPKSKDIESESRGDDVRGMRD